MPVAPINGSWRKRYIFLNGIYIMIGRCAFSIYKVENFNNKRRKNLLKKNKKAHRSFCKIRKTHTSTFNVDVDPSIKHQSMKLYIDHI